MESFGAVVSAVLVANIVMFLALSILREMRSVVVRDVEMRGAKKDSPDIPKNFPLYVTQAQDEPVGGPPVGHELGGHGQAFRLCLSGSCVTGKIHVHPEYGIGPGGRPLPLETFEIPPNAAVYVLDGYAP